ncbi:cysteine hydrolase, partial [Amycolatopsis sp. NPDC059021]
MDIGKQHTWRIEPREYARHEARRGRRFAFPRLVPGRTALVVVDMIPFFVHGNPYCRGIVPAIGRLADALRRAGGTVAWVVPSTERRPAAEEFYGPEVAEKYRVAGGPRPPPPPRWAGWGVARSALMGEKKAPRAG